MHQIETVNEPYKGFIISYPKIRIDTSGWTVNLGSEDRNLFLRLNPADGVHKDHVSLDGAIAKAKACVDRILI